MLSSIGPVHISELKCIGNEESLEYCPFTIDTSACTNNDGGRFGAAAIQCFNEGNYCMIKLLDHNPKVKLKLLIWQTKVNVRESRLGALEGYEHLLCKLYNDACLYVHVFII